MAEVERWITVNGVHVPIMKGESAAKAVGKFIKSRRDKTGARKEIRENQEIMKGFKKSKIDSVNEDVEKFKKKLSDDYKALNPTIKGRVKTQEELKELPYGHVARKRARYQEGSKKLNIEATSEGIKIRSDIKKATTPEQLLNLAKNDKYFKQMSTGEKTLANMAYSKNEYSGNLVTDGRGLWNEKDFTSFRNALDKCGVKEFVNKDSSTGLKDFTVSMLNAGYQITGTKVVREGEKGRIIDRDAEVGIVFKKK